MTNNLLSYLVTALVWISGFICGAIFILSIPRKAEPVRSVPPQSVCTLEYRDAVSTPEALSFTF